MITKTKHMKESIKIYHKLDGYNISSSKKMALRDWNNFKKSRLYKKMKKR